MTPGERTRLAGALNLLGSDQPGEVQAAAAAAARIVQQAGVTWDELLWPAGPAANAPRFGEHARAEPSPSLDDLAVCGRALDRLTPWEQEFVTSCARQRSLNTEQRTILARIAAQLRATRP